MPAPELPEPPVKREKEDHHDEDALPTWDEWLTKRPVAPRPLPAG